MSECKHEWIEKDGYCIVCTNIDVGNCGGCYHYLKWSVDKLQQENERLQADCAAIQLRFEKYVRENCKLIRLAVADGIGEPKEVEGKCGGYAQYGEEPHEKCQECIAAYNPDEEGTAGTELLEVVRAAGKSVDRICPFKGCTQCIAKGDCKIKALRDALDKLKVGGGRDARFKQ